MKTLMGKMQIWSNQIYSFPDSFIEHLPNCSHGIYWRERMRHPMLSAALRVVQVKANNCYVLHIIQEYITIHFGRLTFGTISPSEIKNPKKTPSVSWSSINFRAQHSAAGLVVGEGGEMRPPRYLNRGRVRVFGTTLSTLIAGKQEGCRNPIIKKKFITWKFVIWVFWYSSRKPALPIGRPPAAKPRVGIRMWFYPFSTALP